MFENQNVARVFAFYLPQFHPIPENDKWWGPGFTEWTNVGKAKPLFPGHYQPNVPADLGYYDLRCPETRCRQAQLARDYGVEGFIYWHYWFGDGVQLLERPFKEVLESGEPDFPFALAWANETWSGTLHGLVKGKTLIEQTYPSEEDFIKHFYSVLPAFRDSRYLTCEGKPIFMIYRYDKIPKLSHFLSLWQQLAIENGLPGIFFIACGHNMCEQAETDKFQMEMESLGFNAVNYLCLYKQRKKTFFSLLKDKIRQDILHWPKILKYDSSVFSTPTCRYCDAAFPTILPCWDHTPRSGSRGTVLYDACPSKFEKNIIETLEMVKHKPMDKRIIFLKSWNEWAEGNYVEPDLRWKRGYLEALRRVICQS